MRRALSWYLICLALPVLGCSGTVNYYTLQLSVEAEAFQAQGVGPSVEVRQANFPPYLNNPQMVTRLSSGEILVHEYQRWVEDLQGDFQRVFVQDLANQLKSSQVFTSGTANINPAKLVQIEVQRFDLSEDGVANLTARWTVSQPTAPEGTISGVSVFEEPHVAQSPEARVRALSLLVDRLAEVVRKAILP